MVCLSVCLSVCRSVMIVRHATSAQQQLRWATMLEQSRPKSREAAAVPLSMGGAGSPSNITSPGPRPTCILHFPPIVISPSSAVFCSLAVTAYTNQGNIWHGRVHCGFTLACRIDPDWRRGMGTEAWKSRVWSNLQYLAVFISHGQIYVRIKLKFGAEEHAAGSSSHTKFDHYRRRNRVRCISTNMLQTGERSDVINWRPK